MNKVYQYVCFVICLATLPQIIFTGGVAHPGDTVVIVNSGRNYPSPNSNVGVGPSTNSLSAGGHVSGTANAQKIYHHTHHHTPSTAGSGQNSYNLLSEAMSQAVSHEFSSLGSGSADGACHVDDLECYSGNIQDRLGMEAIRSIHRQLDDDDNGNIDLSESDDFLREELKYDSGYEKRQKAFHFNDDMHISVKELWEAWLRSEVHNWTIEQTTDWLSQSVQLPQYVEIFRLHKVAGAVLPRLAVNNMHYVSNVLGIKDPIHKQKIALKAMDVVLFGPPRETGTRWKDYILVTLLLSAIIGCWYAYQQNKNAKRHLKRMAQDMEGLQRAEVALQEMQKELELARMAQENVATEKLDLERRLKEAPSLTSSNSDLELMQLKQEIETLRNELSRAEIELVDHCWQPPAQLKPWLQYTYELESKYHLNKRIMAEKQLQSARDACEKLRRKRSSLVGAFVSTHGKSIDDVDRTIVEARNSLSEVTLELQERVHRWKQIESMLGFQIANNNGLAFLENTLYNRGGGSNSNISSKNSRGRLTNSTDDLDDDSVQGMAEAYSRQSLLSDRGGSGGVGGGSSGGIGTNNYINNNRDDSSVSDDGDNQSSANFYLGNPGSPGATINHLTSSPSLTNLNLNSGSTGVERIIGGAIQNVHSSHPIFNSHDNTIEEKRSASVSSERLVSIPPRSKKPITPTGTEVTLSKTPVTPTTTNSIPSQLLPPQPPTSINPIGRTPLPPPRRLNSQQSRSISSSAEQCNRPTNSPEAITLEHHYPINPSYQTISSSTIIGPANHIYSVAATTISASSTAVETTTAAISSTATATITGFTTASSIASIPSNLTLSTSSIPHTYVTKFSATTTPNSSAISFANTINNNGNGDTTATTTTTTFDATTGEYQSIGGNQFQSTSAYKCNIQQQQQSKPPVDDTNSTDSSSIGDEQKKRRRKLRFPFGKKSNKSKVA